MTKIDQKDKRILFELDRNCRRSVNELASITRLNRDVVRYRIAQLEKKGVITGYITLIDFTKLGYQLVRLYIKLQNTTAEIEEDMLDYLMDQDSVIIAYHTDGHYELAIGLLVKDLRAYQKTYEAFLGQYREYVIDKHFSVFSDFIQYFHNYLVDVKLHDQTALSTGSHEIFDYDDTDIRILKEISTEARISLVEFSKRLDTPINTIKYRLKRLEKSKVIVAYRAIINFHELGLEYYKVDLLLEDPSIIPALDRFIVEHPHILYRDVTIGGSDFEFDCELESQSAFYALIEEIRALFPKKVRSFFYYKAIKIYKYSYFPNIILKEIKRDKKRD
ncbi:Lrp/AsnC family transcriptional regulator [Candidatus Woesearchaeota archaeon]|nr:Lrp/AsnC family transcriptional regulator [Candidatus Woesearchaeota archaeon]